MDDLRPPHDDREEPPLVQGLFMGATARVEDAVRRFMASIDLRVRLFIWGAGAAIIFFGVLSLSIAQSPDLSGIAAGVFGGLLAALAFAGAFAWLLLWTHPRSQPRTESAETARAAAALDIELAPTLRELNAVRAEVMRTVKAKSVTRVPLGIAAGLALWLLGQLTDDPPDVLTLLMFLVVGAVAGEIWAANKLEREYRRLYKDRILPQLASRFGDLTYKHASYADVHRLQAQQLLPNYDSAEADDAITGTHRGLSLEIVEAKLQRRSGDNSQVVFDGLLIGLTLPRSLTGTTVVLTDEGVFGNLKTRWRSGAMEPVRLEDPHFERRYEVYSTDQIEARALLTPAFMERFMALAARSGFSLPGAIAQGNRLVVALPKGIGTGDLFEPPVYWKRAGGHALLALEQDIRGVLDMADTVIDLDFWARGRRSDHDPEKGH